MADIFGYSKTGTNGHVASPFNVLVSIKNSGSNSASIMLAQQCVINYQRSLQPVYELGSDYVWMSMGQSQGTWQITRAVGVKPGGGQGGQDATSDGLLVPYKGNQDDCNGSTDLYMSGNTARCGHNPGSVSSTGGVLTSVGIQAQVGQLIVTDNATWTITALNVG